MKTTATILSLFTTMIMMKAQAFTINNAKIEMTTTGRTASSVIQVTNDSSIDESISVYMMERSHDENGVEVRKEFDIKKFFLVLPATLKVKAKSSASVRIVYIGPKELEKEAGYRLIFTGSDPKPYMRGSKDGVTASVDAIIAYAASVWVTPEGAKAAVTFKGVKKIGDKQFLEFKNEGKKRAIFPNGVIKLSDGKAKAPEKYEVKKFKSLDNAIMSGETRLVELPKEFKLDAKTLKAEFE